MLRMGARTESDSGDIDDSGKARKRQRCLPSSHSATLRMLFQSMGPDVPPELRTQVTDFLRTLPPRRALSACSALTWFHLLASLMESRRAKLAAMEGTLATREQMEGSDEWPATLALHRRALDCASASHAVAQTAHAQLLIRLGVRCLKTLHPEEWTYQCSEAAHEVLVKESAQRLRILSDEVCKARDAITHEGLRASICGQRYGSKTLTRRLKRCTFDYCVALQASADMAVHVHPRVRQFVHPPSWREVAKINDLRRVQPLLVHTSRTSWQLEFHYVTTSDEAADEADEAAADETAMEGGSGATRPPSLPTSCALRGTTITMCAGHHPPPNFLAHAAIAEFLELTEVIQALDLTRPWVTLARAPTLRLVIPAEMVHANVTATMLTDSFAHRNNESTNAVFVRAAAAAFVIEAATLVVRAV